MRSKRYAGTELEPFKAAAESGCKDFRYREPGAVEFIGHDGQYYELPQFDAAYRMNRYAGAVCESFWFDIWQKAMNAEDDDLCIYASEMAQAAQDYRLKRGGAFDE